MSHIAAAARSRSRLLAIRFGRELRIARAAAGLSQRALGRLAGVSQGQVSRAESGTGDLSLEQRCRLTAAVGHELGWSLYPVATVRLRDSGQLAIAETIIASAHGSWRAQLELPVAPDDRRAADLVLSGPEELVHIEIERTLVDFQAQLRSAQLKRRSLAEQHRRPVRLVIAVADSTGNRSRLAAAGPVIASALPMRSRRVRASITSGEPLGGDGLLFVRARRRMIAS